MGTKTDETPVAAPVSSVLEEASTPLQSDTEQRVRRWVGETLSGGRIARDVESWNELQAALPALVRIIEA